jgi:hypothetical protein
MQFEGMKSQEKVEFPNRNLDDFAAGPGYNLFRFHFEKFLKIEN